MDIIIEDTQSLVSIEESSVFHIVQAVLSLEQASCDELNIYFVQEAEICEVHAEFFNDPSPTDCISIQIDDPKDSPCFLGEIFISPKAAQDYIKESQGDLYEEITLYLVHGLLHLLGYDDVEEEERQKMRLAEKRHINYLKEHHLLLKM